MEVLKILGGELSLPFPRSSVTKVSVVGADVVLTRAGGRSVLIKGLAIEAMVGDKPPRLLFSDSALDSRSLLDEVAKVDLSDALIAKKAVASPLDSSESPRDSTSEGSSGSDAEAAAPAAKPAVPAPPAPTEISTKSSSSSSAVLAAREAPPPQSVVPPSPPGKDGAVPAPKPVETFADLKLLNVTGQTTSEAGGRTSIAGTGDDPESGRNAAPAVQAAPENITGTAGDDDIVGDDPTAMGPGFTKVLEIRAGTAKGGKLESVKITGLPVEFTVTGATKSGDAWIIEVTDDNRIGDASVQVRVSYPVPDNEEGFQPVSMSLELETSVLFEGKSLEFVKSVPAVIRDVQTAADATFSDASGKPGIVFPAFGLGDVIDAGGGNDVVRAGVGADVIYGGEGDDRIYGEQGRDLLIGGAGADVLDGGPGIDAASYADSVLGVRVNLADGRGLGGDAEGDVLVAIENLAGSAVTDELTGDAGANVLDGGGGDDILQGGAGADTLIGGDGFDSADYSNSSTGVRANLATGRGAGGTAEGDTIKGVERIVGSTHDDVLTGDRGGNTIDGGRGDDVLDGGAGADTLVGGEGRDTASYAGSSAAVSVDLGAGTAAGGDAAGDVHLGIENLTGSVNDDLLTGDASANTLNGGAGDDRLDGGEGADRLIGGDGKDAAVYSRSGEAVNVNLELGTSSGGMAEGDTFRGIEDVVGSAFNDFLTGDAVDNVLAGGGRGRTHRGRWLRHGRLRRVGSGRARGSDDRPGAWRGCRG